MEKSKQLADTNTTPIQYWGTLAFTILGMLVTVLLMRNALELPKVAPAYFAMAVYALAFITAIPVILLTIRGRQRVAVQVGFFMAFLIFGTTTFIYTGRALTASFSLVTIAGIIIIQLLPRDLRLRYTVFTALALVLIWINEWMDPSWRLTVDVNRYGPATAILFGVILAVIVVRQAWGGSIRVKLVTSFTVIALISVAIVGTVVYVNYRNQVHQDIRQRLLNILSLVAMNQDGDLHATIHGPEDAATDAHLEILAQNVNYLSTDAGLKYIYTMRKNEQGQIYFVINARQGGEPGDPIGTIYNEPSELLASQFDTLSEPIVEPELYTDVYGQVLASYAPFYRSDGTREGIIGVDIDAEKVLAEEQRVLNIILVTTVLTMLIVTVLGLWLGDRFVGPVVNLSRTTNRIIEGDLSARAEVETTDEVGDLARAFNVMTSQLQGILQGLEQRIADRTRNLELAAEVGRSVSQVRALDVMLNDACQLILREFDLYYVQVYLADAGQTILKLEAGTGSVGARLVERGHSLPFDSSSINGRAAVDRRSVVISDTTQSTIFRQNPLLPETRGELAVPLVIANRVIGILDMQSKEPGVLSEEVLPAFEALAGQLAVAIQNSNLLAEAEQARAEVEKQARRLVQAGWREHLDAIHKPEQLGFVFDRKEVMPLVEGDDAQAPAPDRSVIAPLAITGEQLGSLVVEVEDESRKEQAAELANAVARLVSQQIENLRLLESADRYRHEAERAARIQTLEGWQEFIASRSNESFGYLYDTNEVRPHAELESADVSMFDLPLKSRDEMIGKLSVQGLTSSDQESIELVNAVAERLSAHIENLRLFEETRAGQIELDKRARQLAAVAEVSSVSSQELNIQKMLESVVHLTQRKFGLYHAHIFVYNHQSDMLKIAACGWKEGDEHEGTHGTATIAVSQEQSLVARAARTRQPVIVNNVHTEPGWLPNPLLPDSHAELAVPLIVGDKLLGVLDVQSDKLDAFTQEDANIYATLASQISTALQNAQSFIQAQQQAERESRLNVISQKIQSATTVEAVLQIAARELGHTLGAPLTIAQLGLKETSNSN